MSPPLDVSKLVYVRLDGVELFSRFSTVLVIELLKSNFNPLSFSAVMHPEELCYEGTAFLDVISRTRF